MIKKLGGIVLLVGLLFGSLQAQSVPDQPSFGQAPDSLFSKTPPPNPEVPFIYALKELEISFDETDGAIIAVMDYHVRVKVFDASAKGAAVVGIPYYFKNDIEQISHIRGVTYQSPAQKTPLSPEEIRTINVNARYNVKEFTMPNVQDGSVIEYSYQIRRRYIEELPAFYLSHQVPTALAKISITYPRYLRYKAVVENYPGTIYHSTTKVDTSGTPKIFTQPQPEPIIKESWAAKQIPAIQKESYISSLDDYRGQIKFQLSEFGIPRQPLENSWNFVVAEIRQKQQLFETIRKNERALELGEAIGKALDTPAAVQDSIFRYVNEKTRFSGTKTPFSTVSAAKVLQGNPSDQAAINQTLIAMLRGAGIEAYPVLISTRESGEINTDFPSFFQFNGQLVYTKIDGQAYFMDASFPHSQPNLIPVGTYNETGLLLKKDGYQWIDLQPAKSTFSIKIKVDAQLHRNGDLTGQVQAWQAGYPAQLIRKKRTNGLPLPEIIKQAVFDGYGQVKLSDLSLSHLNDYHEPVQLSADFSLPHYAVSFANGLQFRPMVVGYLTSNPFSHEDRKLPVTLDAPEKLDLIYTISLPEGMSLERAKEDQTIRLPGAVFKERYMNEGNTLQYEFHINISQKYFAPDLYRQLLNLYERWVALSKASWSIH